MSIFGYGGGVGSGSAGYAQSGPPVFGSGLPAPPLGTLTPDGYEGGRASPGEAAGTGAALDGVDPD